MKSTDDYSPIVKDTLKTSDIAKYCGVSVVHVIRWAKSGKLKSFRFPGGRYKFSKKDFRKFLEDNNIPIIEEFFEKKEIKKILIVDDDTDCAKGLKISLETEFPVFKIRVVSDGYEALMEMGQFNPDLLILDIRMPKIDGLEVCYRVKSSESWSDTKIIAITGYSKAYTEKNVLEGGADEFLLKPIKTEELFNHIRKLIGVKSGIER